VVPHIVVQSPRPRLGEFESHAAKSLLQQYRHETDMPTVLSDVRCWVNSGKHMLALSFSGFDPRRSSGLLDDFIRECEHRGRDVEAKSLGSRERR
jgi:hypothetical protein